MKVKKTVVKKSVLKKKTIVSKKGGKPKVSDTTHLNLLGDGKYFKDTTVKRENVCRIKKSDLEVLEDVLNISVNESKRVKNNYCKHVEEMFPVRIVPDNWRITNVLGSGASGVTLGTRGPNNKAGALKIVQENNIELLENEISMGEEFHKLGLSPRTTKVSSFVYGKGKTWFHTIHMGRLDGIIGPYLESNPESEIVEKIVKKVFDLIKKLDDNNIVHGDLHFDNIGFIHSRGAEEVGKIQIIDHGYSRMGVSLPKLEILQLLRSLNFMFDLSNQNSLLLRKSIFKYAEKYFGIVDLPRLADEQYKLFKTLRDEIER